MAIMGRRGATLWPGWKVVETRDFRLIKGVEMKDASRTLQVVIQPPPYGSSEGFEVTATIRSDSAAAAALRPLPRRASGSSSRCRASSHAARRAHERDS